MEEVGNPTELDASRERGGKAKGRGGFASLYLPG